MTPRVIDDPAALPADFLQQCEPMPRPRRLLMCPPDHFGVIDVKNPHMAAHVGGTDAAAARAQWNALRDVFEQLGMPVATLPATPGCEDMVFAANQTFAGLDRENRPTCMLSRMLHASRQREVAAFEAWYRAAGYRVERAPDDVLFEGGGDAIWHPGRRLIWGGHGYRSQRRAYDRVSEIFSAPVLLLELRSEHFYHLDTCFCPLDESTALIHPGSLAPVGVEMIRRVFRTVLECPDEEALGPMACNATALPGGHVVLQRGAPRTAALLNSHGFQVYEIETGEFLKSGGSAYCMKSYLFDGGAA